MGLDGLKKNTMAMKMETAAEDLMGMVPSMEMTLPGLTKEALGLNGDLISGLAGLHLDSETTASSTLSIEEKLMMQAQALLRKSELYQSIEECLHKALVFQPNVYNNLLSTSEDDDQVTSLHRDTAVRNLRFLNIFYGYSPNTFSLAVNLLDRLLGKVKAHPKYLSCIATCCFYIAIRTLETNVFIPSATDLIRLSQCGGQSSDLGRMERLILDKLQWQVNAVTPLTFLQYFYDVLGIKTHQGEQNTLAAITAKLEVLMCHFVFTQFRAETVALALLSHWLEEKGWLSTMEQVTPVLELQYYCQICDAELMSCRSYVADHLASYRSQRSKLPRLQLQWTVSRRTLTKLKPSTRCILDLEPIMEDETDSDTDTGPFDSENDDGTELQRALRAKYNASIAAMKAADPSASCDMKPYPIRPIQTSESTVPASQTSDGKSLVNSQPEDGATKPQNGFNPQQEEGVSVSAKLPDVRPKVKTSDGFKCSLCPAPQPGFSVLDHNQNNDSDMANHLAATPQHIVSAHY